MGGGEALRDLDRDLEGAPLRQPAAGEALLQRLALDQLEHDVGHVALAADVVDADDRGVVDGARGAGLLLEQAQPLGLACGLEVEQLDRDLAAQARVEGAVHLGHAADAERRQQLVRTQPLAGLRQGRAGHRTPSRT